MGISWLHTEVQKRGVDGVKGVTLEQRLPLGSVLIQPHGIPVPTKGHNCLRFDVPNTGGRTVSGRVIICEMHSERACCECYYKEYKT